MASQRCVAVRVGKEALIYSIDPMCIASAFGCVAHLQNKKLPNLSAGEFRFI